MPHTEHGKEFALAKLAERRANKPGVRILVVPPEGKKTPPDAPDFNPFTDYPELVSHIQSHDEIWYRRPEEAAPLSTSGARRTRSRSGSVIAWRASGGRDSLWPYPL